MAEERDDIRKEPESSKNPSMHMRARRRADVVENAKKKKRTLGDIVESVGENIGRASRRVSGVVDYTTHTPVGEKVVGAGQTVAGTRVGQAVGQAAHKAKDVAADIGEKAVNIGEKTVRTGVGAAAAGAEKVKSGAERVKSGAHTVDTKIPFYEQRARGRTYRREDKQTEKQAKAEEKARRADAKLNREWHKQYYDEGSPEYEARIDELCMNILEEQKSFVQYDTDMQDWLKVAKARKEMDERNERYCRNMFDYCISPLQHGISPESVVDTIGLYVGMSVFSKEFRENIGSELQRLALPVRDRLGTLHADYKDRAIAKNIRKADAIIRRYKYDPSGLELCDPPHPKVQWAEEYLSQHYDGEHAEKHAARMRMKADEIAMSKNHGRIPLNPETAALQQLNFMHTYYQQMRDPSLDAEGVKKLRENYDTAMKTLGELMEFDGVDAEDTHKSFRTIVGQLTSVYPEYECEFAELAFDSCVKEDGKKSARPSIDPEGATVCYTWQGEYMGKDGEVFAGSFSPRGILDTDMHQSEIYAYYNEVFSKLDTAEKLVAAIDSVWYEKTAQRFKDMMRADFEVLDVRDSFSKPRRPDTVFETACGQAIEAWRDAHEDELPKFAELMTKMYERDHPGRNADFGADDVEDEGGFDYEQFYGGNS